MVVAVSGSVALAADTIHNFSDALTSVPLWIAFVLGRRRPDRRFTHGYGRAEDLAGLFVVVMIALSAVVAAYESVHRFFEPQPLQNLEWVLAAGVIGFAVPLQMMSHGGGRAVPQVEAVEHGAGVGGDRGVG